MTRPALRCVQEYEEKLSRLQAEYSAEQRSRALLLEDMAALRRAYDGQLARLEQSAGSRGRCGPTLGRAAGSVLLKLRKHIVVTHIVILTRNVLRCHLFFLR